MTHHAHHADCDLVCPDILLEKRVTKMGRINSFIPEHMSRTGVREAGC